MSRYGPTPADTAVYVFAHAHPVRGRLHRDLAELHSTPRRADTVFFELAAEQHAVLVPRVDHVLGSRRRAERTDHPATTDSSCRARPSVVTRRT
jgi:hypothetical protein